MDARLIVVFAAMAAAALAGCDRMKESPKNPNVAGPPQSRADAPPIPPGAPTATISSQVPQQSPPTAAERKAGTPIQGQVDPKETAQRRDFETKKP